MGTLRDYNTSSDKELKKKKNKLSNMKKKTKN